MFDTKLTKIQYIAVEVIKSNSTKISDVECGLLMGICKRKNKAGKELKFITLAISEKSIRLYNLDTFNILTLDILDDDTRYMTVFTDTNKDQKSAISMMNEVTKRLKQDDRLQKNDIHGELIDVETYKDFPEVILTADNISAKMSSNSNTTTTTSTSTTSINTTTYVKKEPKVLNFKRKGKLPSTEKLDSMKDKVVRLASGDFKLKKLHIPTCDLEEIKEEKEEEKKTCSVIV